MAEKTKRKYRKELLVGLGALAAALLILAVLAGILTMGGGPEESTLSTPPAEEAEETDAPEPTLPPPEANPYGPTDFQFDGPYLTCLAGESMLGIDVSEHQREIDWAQVRDAGVEFVMIRVGWRGYETGNLTADVYAQANYQGAKEAGLQVGAYFYSQALSVQEAVEEAEFALAEIADWELDMPLVYDWEYVSKEARTGDMDARTLTDCSIAFCERVKAAGYAPMIYFNQSQAKYLLHLEELVDYGFWLAMYSVRMTYPYRLDMWQYTCQAAVPGIQGTVDVNLYFPE